jgi:Cu+-exporting ATPase
LRKAVVLDKSGTILDPCRVLLSLKDGKFIPCNSTLQYAQKMQEMLVNVRGPLESIMDGSPRGLSLKISYCPFDSTPPLERGIFERDGIMEGLRSVAKRVLSTCDTQVGICTALLISSSGEVTFAVGLGGRLFDDVELAVKSIIASGTDVFIATGNCKESAVNCANLLGIPPACVLADADPEEKRRLVRRLRRHYDVVVMVGNDINDLTAMREADLAIMVERGAGGKRPEERFLKEGKIDYFVTSLQEVQKILSEIR